ncbi:helix-turn-helix domain-containing protein [Levilactobacillus namurensis]|uniref:helix-turn-helix domain-containing protein n=1 Tax=Levilactobacillus namurensis TaxID=380393 RepID=UPI0022322EAA|nr:helix-turn-helix transcriptional regulator [Levilactobacillus namurensis]MCW3777898.1 helix-turn-helix domain-containing protein [Levilactobacillus namurensis]MDT7018247.1 helix-turn-helix transcriptional regulator [Levilactobacillus namurensis]WNN64766.1 helix-turn-helix transcriptional regulator [Levilactobacillus namurensis]
MTTGSRIASLRRRMSMTQPMLAEKMNVSRSTVTSWENDRRSVSNDDLIKLADLFGVTTDYLLGHKIDLGDTPVAAHLRNGLSLDDLPEDRRQAVIDYMEYQKSLYKKEQERKGKKE